MGSSEVMMGFTEKAGSKKDSLNFPLTLAALKWKKEHIANVEVQHTHLNIYCAYELLGELSICANVQFDSNLHTHICSDHLLAGPDDFTGSVFDADFFQWDSFFLHLGGNECLPVPALHFNQANL